MKFASLALALCAGFVGFAALPAQAAIARVSDTGRTVIADNNDVEAELDARSLFELTSNAPITRDDRARVTFFSLGSESGLTDSLHFGGEAAVANDSTS